MLTVVKRSGKEEPFDKTKLMKTIAAAGDEINNPLTESDINNLTTSVMHRFDGRDKVSSKDVYDMLIDCMRASCFNEVAEAYIHFADNHWI